MNRLTFLALPVALLLALALVACGGDDGGEDKAEITQVTKVIETASTGDDPADCTRLRTEEFVEQRTLAPGSIAIELCKEGYVKSQADSAEVSDVAVDGESATAEVTFTGSRLDGQTVELGLVEEGDQWKLDRLIGFVELDRPKLNAALAEEIQGNEDIRPGVRQCVAQQFEALSDEEAQELLISGDQDRFQELFPPCDPLAP